MTPTDIQRSIDLLKQIEDRSGRVNTSYALYAAINARETIEDLRKERERLRHGKAEWYQTAQHYRQTLQEIRDAKPAKKPDEWPHHHWYLCKASESINHCDNSTESEESPEWWDSEMRKAYWEYRARQDPTQDRYPTVGEQEAFTRAMNTFLCRIRMRQGVGEAIEEAMTQRGEG